MSFDEIVDVIERVLPTDRLGAIERFILRQSCLGRTYSEMAHDSGYGSDYIKEVGARLWHDLSTVMGKRVTKKNLQLVFSQSPDLNHSPARWQEQPRLQHEAPVSSVALPQTTAMSFPSGPIPINSPFYIERPPIESLVYAEVKQPGGLIRIRAPRQMGKSSLLNRLLIQAQALSYHTVYLDFQEADQAIFLSLDRFLRWFCINISHRLQLEPRLDDYWDEEMGSKVSCKIYVASYLLPQIDTPIVIALNEVNRIFEHPAIAQDFLPMLRLWHEQAKHDPIWQKLRLALAHSTEVYVPLNLNQSPFNVGLSVHLAPFSFEQVQELAHRYGLNWNNPLGSGYTASLRSLVGGHPYLINLALYHLCRGDITIETLLESATAPTGIYAHHLRGLLNILLAEPELLSIFYDVVTADAGVPLESVVAHQLESLGLIQLNGNLAQPSCELYRSYFQQQLANQNGLKQLEQDATPRSLVISSLNDSLPHNTL
jgi:hypothetical protein